jgi:transposase-like protein
VALITQARLEHEFGASRTRIWLQRIHQVQVATETIQRVFRDIGVPHLVKPRRRCLKQLKLFEKEHPGDSVQVDVKVVARGRSKWFQYTAIDDCTRMRVLRLYRLQNHHSSLAFLRELTAAFPFQIRKIQVDNGTEFPLKLNFGATSEQERPNTREDRASSGTRRRSQALPKATLYGLQNLHPRFKSGRRLHLSREKSRDRDSACARGRFLIAPKSPRIRSALRRATPVKSLQRAELSARDLSGGGGSEDLSIPSGSVTRLSQCGPSVPNAEIWPDRL